MALFNRRTSKLDAEGFGLGYGLGGWSFTVCVDPPKLYGLKEFWYLD